MIRSAKLILIVLMLSSCNTSQFTFTANDEGILLSDNDNPVFYYQKKPKSKTGEYICNNYLHPVYDLKGDTLTEEFPDDHLFHRGVFWAWHQLFAAARNLGDGWENQGISYDVTAAETSVNADSAILKTTVIWKSDSLNAGSFIRENSTITVHRLKENYRTIDFRIVLNPLVDSLQIGGSADEKGYGGFCIRMKMPPDLTFTSEKGAIEPRNLQITAGSWMDFTADFAGNGNKTGMILVSHSSNPGPGSWILRQTGSMQNAVFPGREKIIIDHPLTLRYRIIIYEGARPVVRDTW
jgi:hypothetical protein